MILSYVHQIDNIILMKKFIVDVVSALFGQRSSRQIYSEANDLFVFIHSKTNIFKLFLGFIFI